MWIVKILTVVGSLGARFRALFDFNLIQGGKGLCTCSIMLFCPASPRTVSKKFGKLLKLPLITDPAPGI